MTSDFHICLYKSREVSSGLQTYGTVDIPLTDDEDFQNFSRLCEDTTNMAGFWKASVLPIRTTGQDLPQDLFFPTLIQGAIKTSELASVFLVALAILWDVATLPIRLLTLIPRIVYNSRVSTKEHPLAENLRPLLRLSGKEPRDWLSGELYVKLSGVDIMQGSSEGKKSSYKVRKEFSYKVCLSRVETPFNFLNTSTVCEPIIV